MTLRLAVLWLGRLATATLATGVLATATRAEDWPAFRGPRGDGTSAEESAPLQWSATENIAWKVKLPRPANGSPIVVAGRVFVTSAEDELGKQRSLYCFDRKTGQQLWVRTVDFGKELPTHETNPYSGSTPVADEHRVVVWHASAGLHCYDLDGKPLWSRDLGEFRHQWGYGTSPVLYRNKVVLFTGPGQRSFVTALDAETGKTMWETEEPQDGNGQERKDGKPMGSWTTPVLATIDGRERLLLSLPTRVNAYDPESGSIVWSCDGLRHGRGDLAYSSPIVVGNVCFVTGGYQGPSMAFRMGGSGNITETHRLWRKENSPQSIGTGVVVDGRVYRPNADPGTIECLDPQTGERLWQDRAAGAANWSSIVSVGAHLYLTNQNGTTVVFKPNPEKFEQVAVNHLEDPSNATPAVSGGQLFIRTAEHLFCIGR